MIELNAEQEAMLAGEQGVARQMAMRLVLDMAAAAGASELIPIAGAHLSGVSPLTGGMGLREFLKRLAADPQARVAVPTTLNAAGCDPDRFDLMHITVPNFLADNNKIVAFYEQIGVQPTMSCIPYEWDGVVLEGVTAWAESNAICYGNSYCALQTNRESGLSALACALTGYTPRYGLLVEGNDRPNLRVEVTVALDDPTDYSLLGDWIGMQRDPNWRMPLGPIPYISGLPRVLTHEQRKALTAAAANYGCPRLYLSNDDGDAPPDLSAVQATLTFSAEQLAARYADLAPQTAPDLIVLGCPQASVGELRAIARLLKGKTVLPTLKWLDTPMLWVFTSSANRAIAEELGVAQAIETAGALLLSHTCPEVVPYDQSWVRHVLTNSMKAEHYIKSGLNGIPTSVLPLADCIAVAIGERTFERKPAGLTGRAGGKAANSATTSVQAAAPPRADGFEATGDGLPSQGDFVITGEAFVTAAPITLLGFVNRYTGVIEEPGHPADGESMAGKIAIFPKGSGSTVAPYVLLELFYRDKAPIAIVNTAIDQQCAPACSLEGIPYAYGFDGDVIANIRSGDTVELARVKQRVTIRVVARAD